MAPTIRTATAPRGVPRLAIFLAVLAGIGCSAPARADDLPAATVTRVVALPASGQPVRLRGQLQGRQDIDYIVRVAAGDTLAVTLRASHGATYFNVLPADSATALFVGSSAAEPDHYRQTLAPGGDYRIRVYLMRNAARRNASTRYTLTLQRLAADRPGQPSRLDSARVPYTQTLRLQDIEFDIHCTAAGSLNTLRLVPHGLQVDNSPLTRDIDGHCTGAEVGDLNGDGSPEVYVYIQAAGSGSYGSLVAFAANRRKSLSDIVLPPLDERPDAAAGYQGHDEFAVGEGALLRRFPIYRAGDSNARPSGGMRQLQYRLVPGEASWQLRVDRLVEY